MNERYTLPRPERAERSTASTRRAPVSSLRSARMAEVSRTSLELLAILAAVRDQAPDRARFARPAQRCDRIVRDRNDAHGASLDDPLERCPRRDLELSAYRGRNRDLSAPGHLGAHRSSRIMQIYGSQGVLEIIMYELPRTDRPLCTVNLAATPA